MLIDPMEFIKYDKISDDVYALGPNTVLRFNVSLSKITSDGKRYHFYKEFEYSSHANECPSLVTVKRSFDYYLSIENVQKNRTLDEKAFIRIGPQDYYRFLSQLEIVYQWFTGKQFKNLYAKTKGKLILTSPIPEIAVGGYPQNKFLRFAPVVIDKGEGKDVMEPGVELDLSNYDNKVIMNFDRFAGLYYIIKNFDMYSTAQTLVNYLGFPDNMNRMSMGKTTGTKVLYAEDFESKETMDSIEGRTVGNTKNISALE